MVHCVSRRSVIQIFCETILLRQLGSHLIRHQPPLSRGVVWLGEGGGDEGRDHPAAVLAGMAKGIALEVDTASLLAGVCR